jgi:uncharacterized membrane protein YdjX (TVP38/TMEM64 family)
LYSHRRAGILGAAIVAVALVSWGARRAAPHLLAFLAGVHGLGGWAPLVFILTDAAGIVAFIPGTLFTLVGGAVFGFVPGVLYASAGAALGSTVAFLIGRYIARESVQRRLARMPRFQSIDRAVAADAARIVFLLRLSPIMPFNVLNYALGLTAVRLADFLLAMAGTLPGTIVYAYAGKVMGELALAGPAEVPKNAAYYAGLLAGLVATVAATFIVTRAARRALSEV